MASTEVLAIAIWEELEANIIHLGATLHCIKVQETENNFVEYFGKQKWNYKKKEEEFLKKEEENETY